MKHTAIQTYKTEYTKKQKQYTQGTETHSHPNIRNEILKKTKTKYKGNE